LLLGLALALASALAHADEPVRPSRVLEDVDRTLDRQGVYLNDASRPIAPEADRTLAPYFHVEGAEDGATDRLPVKGVSARIDVAGPIARVTLKQTYENRGRTPIEALYVFPASTRAAVHGVTMTIGRRTVVAKLKRRDDARATYEQARQDGQRASLL